MIRYRFIILSPGLKPLRTFPNSKAISAFLRDATKTATSKSKHTMTWSLTTPARGRKQPFPPGSGSSNATTCFTS